MAAEPQGNRLPFEPSKKRQKATKNKTKAPEAPKQATNLAAPRQAKNTAENKDKAPEKARVTTQDMAVPKVVSNRMARRMALFCGVPSALGVATFIASYFIVSHGWFKLPNVAVLLVSMGFFGLGVLGLSYGVISASWDENVVGSKLGWQEFTTNWGRLTSAWRSARQKQADIK